LKKQDSYELYNCPVSYVVSYIVAFETEQKYKSYIGTKINNLTIKDFIYEPTEKYHQLKYKFLYDCECGTKNKLGCCYQIINNKIKSCGCGKFKGIRPETIHNYQKFIGQKFGMLTIKDFIYDNKRNHTLRYQFLCDCKCGTKNKLISCNEILRKGQKSCGCIKKGKTGITFDTNYKYKSYIGKRINKLTITDFVYDEKGVNQQQKLKFLCDCDCGTKDKLISCNEILNNNQQSCGCIKIGIKPETEEYYKSFIGQKFGKLTVKDFIYDTNSDIKYNNIKYKFLCECECGTTDKLIVCDEILTHHQQTCGCGRTYEIYLDLIEHCKEYNLELLDEFTTLESRMFNEHGNYNPTINIYTFKCLKCNNEFTKKLTSFPICPYCNPNCVTNAEFILSEFLRANNITFRKNMIDSINDLQKKIEIDFHLINYNVGIELHGVVPHATSYRSRSINYIFPSKSNKYHLNKLESTEVKNIDLLQFWNIELYEKGNIVKSIILNRLNMTKYSEYARKCYIKEIDKQTSDYFLKTHHIQGTVANDSVRLGLFHKVTNKLVSVMTFGTARFSEHEWELYRFATYINCRVVGAASKLFKYFIRNYNPSSIVSYSDRRLFNSGKLYSTLGFKLDHISAPNYWYFEKNKADSAKLYHRMKFQKHKLSKILGVFDSNLTEWQNMENNGYLRVYDCGNKVYHWQE